MKLPEKTDSGIWMAAGFCFYCLMSMEAIQPGGRNLRHKSTLTPYLQCPQALKAMEVKAKEKM